MLEKVLLGVVLGVLKFFMDRHTQNQSAKAEVYRELWAQAKKAYEWETAATARSDGGAELRVHDPTARIKLSDTTASSGGPTSPPQVHDQ